MRSATVLSTIAGAFLLQIPLALANIEITTPNAETSWVGGSTVEMKWRDDLKDPSLDDFTTFNVYLCWGSNDVPMCEKPLGSTGAKFSASMLSTKFQIPASAGGNGDVYFIKMETVATAGGYTWNYSPRFALTKMTGTFSSAAQIEQDKGDTTPPAGTDTTSTNGSAPGDAAGSAELPYTLQTGPTRYAPMQSQPGKSITVKEVSMQYPTSACTIFKTRGPRPNVQTTITLPWDYVVTYAINTVAPAPDPHDGDEDMRKFLMRWKD